VSLPVAPAGPVEVAGTSRFNIIQMTLHNISILSKGQYLGKTSSLIVLDLSLRHNGRLPLSFTNRSLVGIISVNGLGDMYPSETRYLQNESADPLFPCTLAPGEEKRGTVAFPLYRGVKSMALYLADRDWRVYGELFIPDLSQGNQSIPGTEYPKTLGLVAYSAVQYRSLLGMTLTTGNRHAVINVSITNRGTGDMRIPREQLFILTERGMTFEHGGERTFPEIARLFLRFPLVIHPGETRNGSLLYIVFPGTRINRLVLTDRNFVIHSIVDLNGIYRYE
jgi:hypothetical protein